MPMTKRECVFAAFAVVAIVSSQFRVLFLSENVGGSFQPSGGATSDPASIPTATVREVSERTLPMENNKRSIMETIAPAFFPLDDNGQINFPPSIETVLVDVGARGSDLMREMEYTNDTRTALILIDPLPSSIMPLIEQAARFSIINRTKFLDPLRGSQVFFLRAAMGEEEGYMDLNIGMGPACSSILKTHQNNTFWCARSTRTIPTMVLTLQGLLKLIPDRIPQLHLKVDAEGADLVVLKGAQDSITRFLSVIIECNDFRNLTNENQFREGECEFAEALKYLEQFGYKGWSEVQGGPTVNGYFAHEKGLAETVLPPFLRSSRLTFRKFYDRLAKQYTMPRR